MKIGLNMHRPAFGSDGAFINLMKSAVSGDPTFNGAPWTPIVLPSHGRDTRPLAVDRYGRVTSLQPNQAAMTNVMVLAGGPHVLTFSGEGTIVLGPGATNVVLTAPGHMTCTLAGPPALQAVQLQVLVTATNPANPVRNIRLVPAAFETATTQVFHPNFLAALKPFSVIRMHEWARMDEVSATNWADRTPPSQQTQAGQPHGGVAFEDQILLGNTLAKDIWVNVPHLATDDFVTQMALLLRDTLDPSLKIYLEYSNECWNGGYQQHAYCVAQGTALGLDPVANRAGLRFQALRSSQIYSIFRTVFGATEAASRVINVLSAQIGATLAHEVLLSGSTNIKPDVFAVACYFGYPSLTGPQADALIAGGIDGLMNDLISNAVPATTSLLQASYNDVQPHGIPLVCYEGGQSLLASPNLTQAQIMSLNTLFDQANEDPRMGTCMTNLFTATKTIGFTLVNHFASFYRPNQFGRWGLLHVRDQDPTTSVKYQATTNWIASNP